MPNGRLCPLLVALASVLACGKPAADSTDKAPVAGPATHASSPPVPDARPGGPSGGPSGGSDGYDTGALGALHFEISGGTPEARQHFNRGLLALHSFWYDEAIHQFEAAIEADKTFSMAYWGLAMSHSKLLWGDDDLAAGRDALTRMPGPNLLPPHDQAWVVAALSLFRSAKADVQSSRRDFLAVMEQLHRQFPDDESALFLALALLSTVRPDDPAQLEVRKRAGALAAEVFQRNPKHPGAAHYMIHAYDTPELAPMALPAAQQYASIAPAAFHALHMPAHIFVRLGRWKEAVASCQAAWDASVAWVRRDKLSPDHQDFHSLSWLVELSFERGRRKDAERAMTVFADAVRAGLTHDKRAAYANQVASFLARTGEWARVDELLAPLQAPATAPGAGAPTGSSAACGHPPLPNGPPTELFERRAVLGTLAQAAAMRRDPALLARTLDQRDAVDAELRPFLVATQPKEFVDSSDQLRGLVRKALLARARGDDRALVAALRPLATDQDREFTGEGTAGGLLHHEDIAEALLRLGQAKQALNEYEVVLANHAGRARSLLGAARAAARAGDAAGSREFYRKLVATWGEADEATDGLAEARKAVAAGP
jgi:tetratricopeptide (TPR) repeat protein